MLDKYLNQQDVVTKLLQKSLKSNKLVQAYLFYCDDIDYIYEYAKDFTKEIIGLSNIDDQILQNIYKRIDNEEYTELKIILPSGNFIKKEQLLELQNSVMNKPVEGNKIVYIIKNCERLNSSSANSILKFLEEPADDIIAILLTDNIDAVMPTIKSRCQILNFKNMKQSYDNQKKFKKYILPENVEKDDEQLDELIGLSIEFIKEVEKKKLNTFIYEKDLLFDRFISPDDIRIMLDTLLCIYVDSLYSIMNKEIKYMFNKEEIIEYIKEKNNQLDIIKKISIINDIKNQLKMNVNTKLLFDKLIIELSEV